MRFKRGHFADVMVFHQHYWQHAHLASHTESLFA